jgi:hypothetical protein
VAVTVAAVVMVVVTAAEDTARVGMAVMDLDITAAAGISAVGARCADMRSGTAVDRSQDRTGECRLQPRSGRPALARQADGRPVARTTPLQFNARSMRGRWRAR